MVVIESPPSKGESICPKGEMLESESFTVHATSLYFNYCLYGERIESISSLLGMIQFADSTIFQIVVIEKHPVPEAY